MVRQNLQELRMANRSPVRPGCQSPLPEGKGGIGDNESGIEFRTHTETAALGASTLG